VSYGTGIDDGKSAMAETYIFIVINVLIIGAALVECLSGSRDVY
jgi:hypothetical protein